ncbi:UDP-N-acetylglucosamine 1-carboxyvinyltransferase [Candidatus Pelagibacter bacterium]|nr:UDP-N-acetylglucosamine 1-carboxyvinyltransferase [Candidatus Pelagibacter bacterium]|tara:strand:+ start:1098 stop:2348 length:1251 start_codon:yes stop_codon:yes gene_type:complete
MKKLEVFGAVKLKGQVKVSGSKNAALPILAATLLSNKKITLKNLPKVKDIETMVLLLKSLGSTIEGNKILTIKNRKQTKTFASYSLVKTMRAGILVLGPLLAKFGKAKVSLPGGCAIGTRPVDIHLQALSKLGVKYKIIQGYVHANAPKGLVGTKIKFPKISVGATENLIIAGCLAKGKTILSNCAIEPEIKDLVNFLVKMGCNIKWISKRSIKIEGVSNINELNYQVMPDRIEAGTYLIAAALTEGNLKIKGINPKIINTEINILKKIGAKITLKQNEIKIQGSKNIKNINIRTSPYPGFPTDLQAQMMVLLCKANKKSYIREEIFENRFMHVAELNRMGAKISINGNKATIEGNIKFEGAELMATDLRASVSLILAALASKGRSLINRIYHLDRGYEGIEKKLNKIGAKIKRIN